MWNQQGLPFAMYVVDTRLEERKNLEERNGRDDGTLLIG